MAAISWVLISFSSVLIPLNIGFGFANLINDTAIINAQPTKQTEDAW